jgi:hypothetical protein
MESSIPQPSIAGGGDEERYLPLLGFGADSELTRPPLLIIVVHFPMSILGKSTRATSNSSSKRPYFRIYAFELAGCIFVPAFRLSLRPETIISQDHSALQF